MYAGSVYKASVHCCLARHCGPVTMWNTVEQSKAIHFMVAGKQKEKGARVPISPSR